jgi:thioredoxin 1
MAIEFNQTSLDEAIGSGKAVLVDFWAEWCGPCRMVGPIVKELSDEYNDTAIVGKVNVDDNGEVAAKYGIRNIPTILFFKNGILVDKIVGAAAKASFKEKLDSII